ncbi:MAG: glycoside hydrolase family 38 C-terminal domain-containing protein [Capsulimonas sp.]|uniref:glycoside hydrolase family 38 N-terminal domain-containing protein n=1 Tax=Capsulimonas sp. TaxID=2494211 RepID=UPI003264A589
MAKRFSPALLGAAFLLGTGLTAHAQAAPKAPGAPKDPTLYVIGYSHLDTEWRWSYPQTIREYLANTLHQNFEMIEKYPNYLFNWTGSNRYRLMQEYYPEDFARLKQYVAAGRWFPAGSSVEECDLDIPSEESLVRQVLYGNNYFRREFGVASNEFMDPDAFGYPGSIPTILAHCGLKGFSTQKLFLGSTVGIPFNVGVWEGLDGQSVTAALNPGRYGSTIDKDLSHDPMWIDRIQGNIKQSGVPLDLRYYGVGDQGGSPAEASVQWMEKSVNGGGPVKVVSAPLSQLFDVITPEQKERLPRVQGDMLLTNHSAGSITSQAYMKRWNRKNEVLADAAERASVAADWLGGAPYDKARLTDAWLRFLPGQFHDLMAGTALPQSFSYAWNDQIIAMNEFAGVLKQSAGGVARAMDTRAQGVPIVVYNPLSIARQDIVSASVAFPGAAPAAVRVFGPDGREVPAQVVKQQGGKIQILFAATVPSVGFAAYDVRPAAGASKIASPLSVTKQGLENARYKVRLDTSGDVASIYDKTAQKELLSAPARLAFQHENPSRYPAWNMDWEDQQKPPRAYVDGPATVRIVENGPARVALQIERRAQGSRFVQTIRLSAGDAGNRVEFSSTVDWKTKETALKAIFPLSVSNPNATYNWGPGTIQRSTNKPTQFEVPAHQWFDLTDTNGRYGVSVLNQDKYGSDKPDDHTLRLTLLYTPGVNGGYQDQGTQDLGRHEILYALQGHAGDWRQGQTPWEAARLNQPLVAFQTPSHAGTLGKTFSLLQSSSPQVSVDAVKQAEDGREIIIRVNELSGKSAKSVTLAMAGAIVSAREVNGQEQPMGAATVKNGKLVFDMLPYRPRAFALTLAASKTKLSAPTGTPLALPYNADVISAGPEDNANRFRTVPANFDGNHNAIPGELLPAKITSDGVVFTLAPRNGAPDAVACQGQTLPLPTGRARRVYLLAASSEGDVAAKFLVDAQPVTLNVQSWDGFVGQWDTRLWSGVVPEYTFDWHNPMVGLAPGYIKPASVAWYADHKRLANGQNDPYQFCYLFKYAIDIPEGAKTLRLPTNPRVRILAATLAQNPNDDTVAAQPLMDVLDRADDAAPEIEPSGGVFHNATSVTVQPPLYSGGATHYTLDGTKPGPNSPVYDAPILLTKPTTVQAVLVENGHAIGPISRAKISVNDTTPPTIQSAATAATTPTVAVKFSEALNRASAEIIDAYQLQPTVPVTNAALSADGRIVTLTLAAPVAGDAPRIVVTGVRDVAGNPIKAGTETALEVARPVLQIAPPRAFNGADVTLSDIAGLPNKGGDPWTINTFVFMPDKPTKLTLLVGFGDTKDTHGQQRYLGYFNDDGIHFWGSGVDIATHTAYDLGKWQMITVTYDGDTIRIYKNAKEIAASPAALADAAPEVHLAPSGPWTDAGRFTGRLQNFTIWNKALAPASVQALTSAMPAQ